ncbi:putative exostosin [Helianthus anomalus]
MSAVEYRSSLKYRLMIPMFPNDETCSVCRKACLDKYGEHALHCRELPGFKYRHDFVRDTLMDILRRAGISAKKEAPVNFLTDPSEGRSIPLAGFRENGFVAGQAVLKTESKKVEKHAKACEDNQHAFVPLAFDTFGSLAPEAVRFLARVQRVVHSNFSTPQGRGFVFSRLGFSIQKGMAA